MKARRSLLYMPGNDLHKIKKATTLGVDCICMDLEDGVAVNRKQDARETILEAMRTLEFGQSERLVRLNPIGSGMESEDISTIITTKPDGFVIPKVDHAYQILWVSQQLDFYEQKYNWPHNSICLLVIVESAKGILNLAEISHACPRLQALIFGADDFAGDIGAVRTPSAWEVFYARSAVITHAVAYQLQAIDMVFVDLNDIPALRQESEFGARMGFTGKQIIHPNQVIPVQEAFTPTDESIRQAKELIEAYDRQQKAGVGAFALNGKLIDAPIIRAAQQILAKARAAGKIE